MAGPITLAELVARVVAHVAAKREADRRRAVVLHARTLPRRARAVSRNTSTRIPKVKQ